jgi:DNA-binding CsgD family transcriptional regulator
MISGLSVRSLSERGRSARASCPGGPMLPCLPWPWARSTERGSSVLKRSSWPAHSAHRAPWGWRYGGHCGEPLLRAAIEVLEGPDTRLEQARAQRDLGALLRRENHRVAARQPLRQALEAAHHLGADPLADQAEAELRATGAKSRRVLLTGLEALTASERRIAELAANGLTNREIAQTLFITARTVEGHLTHIFHKLDVKARSALPAALSAPTQAVRS